MHAYQTLQITFVALLITTFGWIDTARCEVDIGFANKVINKVYGSNLSSKIKSGDRILNNQRIRTSIDSCVDLRIFDNSNV